MCYNSNEPNLFYTIARTTNGAKIAKRQMYVAGFGGVGVGAGGVGDGVGVAGDGVG